MVVIRRAVPSDAERIHRIHVDSIRVLCARDYSAEQVESWVRFRGVEDYRRALESGEMNWVAMVDGVVAGYATFVRDELTALFVEPGWARRGVGKSLIETVEQHARELGLKELFLQSTRTARLFYERLEYEALAEEVYVLPDGVGVNCIKMIKKMTA
ncbi:MAG TPA: GNAT family N-acetyltransferase [Tepidisphaeraceae bacterium]|jgi:putative acetyltransferase|nr:GNAT family N-acetyltransferase [Tepidisphaeraceae bacterium]